MCTLSWQIRNNRLSVVFNRDEFFCRPDAHPPETETLEGVRVLAPRDPEGGGTWIAANEYGMVFCLMNNYQAGAHIKPDREYRSRGLLVRSLSHHSDLHHLRTILADIPMQEYRPFHLIVFPGAFPPVEWRWNGRKLTEIVGAPPMLTTAGILSDHIAKKRTRLFRKATDEFVKELNDEQQLSLHRSRRPWPSFRSIAMKLPDRGTVSLTQVVVEPGNVTMNYQPGDPAATPHPTETFQLERNGSPEPARKIIPCEPYPGKPVDVIRILGDKNPELQQSLPRIARSALRLVVREKKLNTGLDKVRDLPCNFISAKVLHHTGVRGHLEPASGALPPPETRPVFLVNHPTGGLDGMLILHWLSTYYPDIRLVVNDLLWNMHHIRPYIVPVDLYGDSRKALKTLVQTYEGNHPLIVFPSGRAARKKNGVLTEEPWKKNAVKMAIAHERSIVPIRLDGRNSQLFYSVAWLRNLLGISMNLEILLFSHEFFSPKCKDFGMTVGSLLSPEQVRALGESDEERAEALRRICVQQTP